MTAARKRRGPKPTHLPSFADHVEAGGGEAAIFARITAGETIASIIGPGYDRSMFYKWIKAGGEVRRAAYAEAKQQSADALVEQAGDILDNTAPASTADVMLAKERAGFRKWLAGVRNPEEYGDRPAGVSLTLELGQLHLNALRATQQAPAALESGPVVDAELIEGD